ncbi:hypothetical protein Fmac_012037 [Flemingia macrophylla]|uniref:Uncharacterized protein n=1 Tax=Flemingia macrophylla TaxID=520843 RepID=A0ABD1MPK2_9FABA
MSRRTTVIGPEYRTPYPMTLVIVRTVKKLGFPDKFRRMTRYHCWEVFRGESRQQNDLLFSVKKNMIQPKTNLNVFLATNTKKYDVCDFMIQGTEGSESTGLYIVKDVQSDGIIAKVKSPKHFTTSFTTCFTLPIEKISKYVAPRSFVFSKENVVVKLEANVDHAYIVVLTVIHMLICRQA